VPDELTPATSPADAATDWPPNGPAPPAAPLVGAATPDDGRPSWLRAALWSILIIAAGVALGGAGYRLERSYLVQLPAVERTADALRVTARPGHDFGGLAMAGTRLIWQDGASIEYMDSARGEVLLLGPGAGMRVTWQPAVSGRFAVWFEAERQVSIAARIVVYDTGSGRRRALVDVGSVRSFPSLSGDLAVWCSAVRIGRPQILAARIGTGEPLISLADGDGAPVVSGNLVAWAAGWTGPFYARDISSGSQWPVTASLTSGKLTGLALSGRTLVWGQKSEAAGSGVVSAVDVDGGGQRTMASGVSGLVGPSYDGKTVVWAESAGAGSSVMARRPGSGGAFVVAAVDGAVTDVAVSGDSAAWIQHAGDTWSILVRKLPR
jgi:hypothetical protein